jgi:PIN domain nuclease of toxin-antitoxin system
MTDRLLLDTHIALWLDSGDDRLRPSTRGLVDGCWRDGGTIFLSAVTAWEIALLVDTGRIDLDLPVEAWIERFLRHPASSPRSSAIAPPAAAINCIISSTGIPRTGF